MLPPSARALLVLAHGAGAGMRHPFLEAMARGLVERGIASFRYEFAYMEERKRRPDPPAAPESIEPGPPRLRANLPDGRGPHSAPPTPRPGDGFGAEPGRGPDEALAEPSMR